METEQLEQKIMRAIHYDPIILAVIAEFVNNKAGIWSALQWITSPDKNLGETPLHFIFKKKGDEKAVLNAARAFLEV